MKKTLLILMTALSLYSCTKNNPDNGGDQNTLVKSIAVYNPTGSTGNDLHQLDVHTFDYFPDGRLRWYAYTFIDSTYSPGYVHVNYDRWSFTFNYSGNSNRPDSYSFVDSSTATNSTYAPVLQYQGGIAYDAQSRLTADTVGLPPNTSRYDYAYKGDTVIYMETRPGFPRYDISILGRPMLLIKNGSILNDFWHDRAFTYSSIGNPLQNTGIAQTYGPLFYGGLAGAIPGTNIPADFISKNLPSSFKDTFGNTTTFNWTVDSRGRVTKGTVTNLHPGFPYVNGTVYITYTY